MVDIKLRNITAPDVTLDTILPTVRPNNDHTVNLFESIPWTERLDVPLGAVQFTNTTAAMSFTGPTGTQFSFTAWVKVNTDTNFYALWLSLAGASSSFFQSGFAINGTDPILNDFANEISLGTGGTGTWFFFGVTEGAAGAYTAFFGQEGGALAKFSGTFSGITQPLANAYLGGDNASEYLAGSLSEVRAWDVKLTDTEILAEFYSATRVKSANSIGWWKFEQSSTKTTDSSGASNTLVNTSGTGTYATAVGPVVKPAPSRELFENVPLSETLDVVHAQSTYASGASYSENLSETVSVAESLAATYDGSVTPSETVTVSESLAASRGMTEATSETVTVSESLAVSRGMTEAPSETVTLSDAIAAVFAAAVTTSETVTLSESLAASRGMTEAPSETVTVSESLAAQKDATVTPSETVTLSESLTSQFDANVALAETVTLSEAVTVLYAAIVALTESPSWSESLSVVTSGAYAEDVSETVTLSEAVIAAAAYVVSLVETVNVSESLTVQSDTTASVSETVSLTESVSAAMATQAALNETLTLSDTLAAQQDATAPLSETVALTESIASFVAAAVALQETIGWSESVNAAQPIVTLIALIAELREAAWRVAVASQAFAVSTKAAAFSVVPRKERNMQVYEGTRVRLEATFTDPTGARYDPAAPQLIVVDVDGTETTYSPPTVVHDQTTNEVGDYYCDVLFATAGDARYAWRSTTSGEETAGEGKVRVLPSSI